MLTYHTDPKIAQTKQPITIVESSNNVVKAIGAKADLQNNTVDLLSRVRGHYEQITNNSSHSHTH